MDKLKDILISLFQRHLTASVVIVILLVAGLIFIVWWSAAMYFKLKNKPCDEHKKHLEKHEEKITLIDILNSKSEETKKYLDKHEEKINSIEILNAKFDIMIQTIDNIVKEKKSPIIQSYSPISLTDYGKELAKELNMEHHINQNWSVISKHVEEKARSMNPYDIQQFCIEYVILNPDDVLSSEGNNFVKLKAFNLGESVFGLYQAAAIIIRDKFFKEHNINIFEIDRYKPAKTN